MTSSQRVKALLLQVDLWGVELFQPRSRGSAGTAREQQRLLHRDPVPDADP